MSTNKHSKLRALVHSKFFSKFILTIVFLNAAVIGLQSYPHIEAAYSTLLRQLDIFFLFIFAIEVVLKIMVDRTKYFKDGWNIFDFSVVAISLIFINSHYVIVLRILRVLRVLKMVSAMPSLRRIITSLFMAIPAIGSIAMLLFIVMFIYGVIGTMLFGEISPVYFGDLSKSLVTLFQVATFESWASVIYRPIAEHSPFAFIYFLTFIFVVVFIMLNLVVGEIVNNASKIPIGDENDREDDSESRKTEESDIKQLQREVRELKLLLMEERNERQSKSG